MASIAENVKKAKNILLFALKPKNFIILSKKLLLRRFDKKSQITLDAYKKWLKDNLIEFSDLAKSMNSEIWEESKQFATELENRANSILSKLNITMGGGGLYPFLYFLTRIQKPEVVFETGVAAGYSSQAFLKAMEVNKKGMLYSSDLPYFRIADPEKYIGIIVEEHLKSRWKLYIEGDELNFNKILPQIKKIDLFHYDSDKSYLGRETALKKIANKITDTSILIFDDIDDNPHFYDLVMKTRTQAFYVFFLKGKYIGLIGKLN